MRTIRLGVLLLAGILAAGLLAACGGGGDGNKGNNGNDGEVVSLDEYFQQIDELAATLDSDLAAVPAEDPATVDEAVDQLADVTAAFDGFANSLDGIEPPDEAAGVHESTVSALHAWVDELNGVSDDVANAESPDDALALLNGLDTTELEAAQQGCRDLQALADENSIEVDLNCAAA